jgi:hypothetical protein
MLLAFDQDRDWPDFNPAFTRCLRSSLVTRRPFPQPGDRD